MKPSVLVTGATGLVGTALCCELKKQGHCVRTLSRGNQGTFNWDVDRGTLAPEVLDGIDVVVHLAGEPVAQRWTRQAKRRIRDSRVHSTKLLVDAILDCAKPPALVCASGVNYYGYNCGKGIDESSPLGRGFLADVCRDWEATAQPLTDAGLRAVHLRTGMVLSGEGGALAKMLPIFKSGLGGAVGSGRQWLSWIGMEDLVRIYIEAICRPTWRGPLNAVAPEPVTNRDFAKALGQVLGRPACISTPALALRALLGEMARETVLADLGVHPAVLASHGFEWQTPTLTQALQRCMSR